MASSIRIENVCDAWSSYDLKLNKKWRAHSPTVLAQLKYWPEYYSTIRYWDKIRIFQCCQCFQCHALSHQLEIFHSYPTICVLTVRSIEIRSLEMLEKNTIEPKPLTGFLLRCAEIVNNPHTIRAWKRELCNGIVFFLGVQFDGDACAVHLIYTAYCLNKVNVHFGVFPFFLLILNVWTIRSRPKRRNFLCSQTKKKQPSNWRHCKVFEHRVKRIFYFYSFNEIKSKRCARFEKKRNVFPILKADWYAGVDIKDIMSDSIQMYQSFMVMRPA